MAGVPPRIMGIGPVAATQRLCARPGLKPADFDAIERNEAFASRGLATPRELGMSGARITGTAALELQLKGGRRSLYTRCIGVAQGAAVALERV